MSGVSNHLLNSNLNLIFVCRIEFSSLPELLVKVAILLFEIELLCPFQWLAVLALALVEVVDCLLILKEPVDVSCARRSVDFLLLEIITEPRVWDDRLSC